MQEVLCSVLFVFGCIGFTDAWNLDNIYSPYFIDSHPQYLHRYSTNSSDHLRLLQLSSHHGGILLGGRNALYNLTIEATTGVITTASMVEWPSTDAHRQLCTLKGKQDNDCQNYVRIFAETEANKAIVCGTNSYKPMCRHYALPLDAGSVSNEENVEAQGKCPYSPTHSSTYVFTEGQLFTGTVADFSGADPLIYRENQRTEQYDLKQLNQPAFVRSMAYDKYIFFIFREIAMEHMNCGKAVYSRIGRVCRDDRGGPAIFHDRWTSFLKSRLNCSLPGEYPFYFDNVVAASDVMSLDGSDVIYGIFTTPSPSIAGSAVCVFRMADVLAAFDGPFKAQKDTRSNWLPVSEHMTPSDPRPGSCVDDSRTLPSSTVNFVKTHPLMEQAVPSLYGEPLLVTTGTQLKLTSVTVAPIRGADNQEYNVIFAGTTDGRLVKFYSTFSEGSLKTIVIAESQVLNSAVTQLTIDGSFIVVISEDAVVTHPLNHCSNYTTCGKCVGSRDPGCGWNEDGRSCESVENGKQLLHALNGRPVPEVCTKSNWVEDRVVTRGTVSSVGSHPQSGFLMHQTENRTCPEEAPPVEGVYSAKAMTFTLVPVATFALAIGCIVGFIVGQKCRTDCILFGQPPVEHRNHLTWSKSRHNTAHSKDINLLMNTNQFCTPSSSPHPAIFANVLTMETTPTAQRKLDNLGLVDLDMDGKDRRHESKNSTESLEKDPLHLIKTDTLQKVKKTYI
ncbi:Semaphorin [Sergentomyia squamirostris]